MSSLSPVLTLFWAQPGCSKLGPNQLDQVSRQKWLTAKNNLDGNIGNHINLCSARGVDNFRVVAKEV